MLPHTVHDVESSLLPYSAGRLRCDSERIYEGLGVVLSNIGEEVVDVPPNVVARRLDTGDDLE